MRQIQLIHKDKIKPYANNPRNNTNAVAKVAESIKEFGFTNPLILDRDYNIIAGHTRFKAGQTLGITEYPCIIVSDLSEAQAQALRLVDNRTAEYAEWDTDLLMGEIEILKDTDFNMELLDFDDILKSCNDIDCDSLGDDFTIPSNDKPDYKQITITLKSDNADKILAFQKSNRGGALSFGDNFNENSNIVWNLLKDRV